MTPSVNAAPTASSAPEAAPAIVSVNARGGVTRNASTITAVIVAIFSLLAVAGLYAYHWYSTYQQEEQARLVAEAKSENKAAMVGRRRNFSSDPPEPPKLPAPVVVPPLPAPAKAPERTPPPIPLASAALPGAAARSASRYGGALLVPANTSGQSAVAGDTHASRDPAQALRAALAAQGYGQPQMMPVGFGGTGQAPSASPSGPTPMLLAQGSAASPIYRGETNPDAASSSQGTASGSGPGDSRGGLGAMLRTTNIPKVRATMLGDRNFILPRGRTIDCSLSTRVVTEVSGMAECVVSSRVYSANGNVVLLEAGSQASGEYVATMAQGQRRLAILWDRVVTPNGVVINLASPSSDALGTAGVGGYVDNRWGDRIGAAVLLSLVEDAIAYAAAEAASRNGNGSEAGLYAFSNTRATGDRMVNQILQQTLAISPTLYKNQGDRVAIYVARDLDFEPVYALRRK